MLPIFEYCQPVAGRLKIYTAMELQVKPNQLCMERLDWEEIRSLLNLPRPESPTITVTPKAIASLLDHLFDIWFELAANNGA
ncbi:hypothetical protein ACFLZL_05695 [Thermodesulfobacteriota bacterium]